jgi:hypothetical protein
MLVPVEDADTAREKSRGIYRQYWPSQCPSAQVFMSVCSRISLFCVSTGCWKLVSLKDDVKPYQHVQFYRVRKKNTHEYFKVSGRVTSCYWWGNAFAGCKSNQAQPKKVKPRSSRERLEFSHIAELARQTLLAPDYFAPGKIHAKSLGA